MQGTEPTRGQTTIDFAIGISVFLIVVAFTISFVPGMLEPFAASDTEHTVTADRVASGLAQGLLADPDREYILETQCTIAFFEDDDENTDGDGTYSRTTPDGCNFEDVALEDRLGVAGIPAGTGPRLNVTLIADINDVDGGADEEKEVLCIDETDPNAPAQTDDGGDYRIIDSGMPRDDDDGTQCDLTGGDDDVLFAIGDSPPVRSTSVVVARRIVRLDGHPVTLRVRVW